MHSKSYMLFACACVISLSLVQGCSKKNEPQGTTVVSELVPLRVYVEDVVFDQKWGTKALYKTYGYADIMVDLSSVAPEFSEGKIEIKNLPSPRVVYPRLEENQIEIYDETKGWIFPEKILTELFHQIKRKAQANVEVLAGSQGVLRSSREQTHSTLLALYNSNKELPHRDVFLTWKEDK